MHMYVQMLYRKTASRRGLSFESEDVNVISVCIVHTLEARYRNAVEMPREYGVRSITYNKSRSQI